LNSKQAFNYNDFAKINARHETDFSDYGTVIKQGDSEGSTYTFRDNGSNVLGVAHLDTVQEANWSKLIKVKRESVLLSPRLDDRLGVYIITSLLPKLGVNCDWLLTTGEEIGQSSAELFRTDKHYKWAFQFDRAGCDAVLYHYEHKALKKLLRKAGFRIGQGSFSDISSLDIGCSGINFGCGYRDAHSLTSHAFLSDTFRMVDKFRKFWLAYSETSLPYHPRDRYERYSGYGRLSSLSYPSYRDTYSYPAYWNGEMIDAAYYTNDEKAYLDWTLQSQSRFDRDMEKQFRAEQQEALEQLADTSLDNGE
jgi:hypothetical protein